MLFGRAFRSRLRSRPLALAFVCLILLLSGIGWWRVQASPLPPLETSFWYWHQPFRLNERESARLRGLGVREMFVRAGTFRWDAGAENIRLTLPQVWKTPATSFRVHLVFNADYALIRRFEKIPEETFRVAFVEGIRREQDRAKAAGVDVAGIQIDFDCPTRLLPRYARLLSGLRTELIDEGLVFSISMLTTWFTSRDFDSLLTAVDFYVPQFYEAVTPREYTGLGTFPTISSDSALRRGLKAAGRRRASFYAGIPVYGHALVFDDRGRLRGAYHDSGAVEALRRPDFRLTDTTLRNDESLLEFIGSGSAKGFHIVYDLPTPEMLARCRETVQAERPRNCRGMILFRYPEEGETQTVPLPALETVLAGRSPAPDIRVSARTRRHAPWQMIESGEQDADAGRSHVLLLTVENVGDGGTRVAPDGVELLLYLDHPGLTDIEPGGFDSAEPFAGEPGARSSLLRADGLRLRLGYLAPGASVTAGPFVLPPDGPTRLRGEWKAALTGGGQRAGDIPEINLNTALKSDGGTP
jgi:hypothetical protein